MTKSYTFHEITDDIVKTLSLESNFEVVQALMGKKKFVGGIYLEWRYNEILVSGAMHKTYPITPILQHFGFSPKLGDILTHADGDKVLDYFTTFDQGIYGLAAASFNHGVTQETMSDTVTHLVHQSKVDLGGVIVSTHLAKKLYITVSSPSKTDFIHVNKVLLEVILSGEIRKHLMKAMAEINTANTISLYPEGQLGF